jgi:hypothetical protein
LGRPFAPLTEEIAMTSPPDPRKPDDFLEAPPHRNRGAGLIESLRIGGLDIGGSPFFYQALIYLLIVGTLAFALLWFFWPPTP